MATYNPIPRLTGESGGGSTITAIEHDGAATDTLTFSGVGGFKLVRLTCHWRKSTNANRRLFIRPNGISTDQLTIYTQGDAGGGAGDLSLSGILFALGDRGDVATAVCTLTLTTGAARTWTGYGGAGNDATFPTEHRNFSSYGRWRDTATAVTTLEVFQPETDILAGTFVTLERLL